MTLETDNFLNTCYIGIGSNLDNPLLQVSSAIEKLKVLPDSAWRSASSLYRSAPVGPAGQDDYINAVACIKTSLSPEALLDALQHIENSQHRVRKERWGARTLDLDILLFDQQTIESARLSVPHQQMFERNFVLIPLAEIAPKIVINSKSIDEHIHKCPQGALEKITSKTGHSL